MFGKFVRTRPHRGLGHTYVWIFSAVFSRNLGTFWILYKCVWDLGTPDDPSPYAPAPATAWQYFIVVSSGALDIEVILFGASEHVCCVVEPCIISLTLLEGLLGLYHTVDLCRYNGSDPSLKPKAWCACALQCTHISTREIQYAEAYSVPTGVLRHCCQLWGSDSSTVLFLDRNVFFRLVFNLAWQDSPAGWALKLTI